MSARWELFLGVGPEGGNKSTSLLIDSFQSFRLVGPGTNDDIIFFVDVGSISFSCSSGDDIRIVSCDDGRGTSVPDMVRMNHFVCVCIVNDDS